MRELDHEAKDTLRVLTSEASQRFVTHLRDFHLGTRRNPSTAFIALVKHPDLSEKLPFVEVSEDDFVAAVVLDHN